MNARHAILPLAVALSLSLAACKPSTPASDPAAATEPAPATTTDAAPATEAEAPAKPDIVAQSGTYTIDPSHTMVIAQWSHLGFSNPSLNFADAAGTIVYNAEDPSASSVEVTLPLSGITSYTDKFNEHLSSSDFFDVAKFPQATFKSTSVSANGGNKFTVAGDLTIKDVTRPVTLDVTLNGAGPHPMAKVPAIGFDATTQLKRSEFGLGMAAPAVSDDVEVRITTEATAPAAEAPAEQPAEAPADAPAEASAAA